MYGRLEAARLELEELRRGTRTMSKDIEPWLMEQLGWPGSLDDSEDD